VSCSCKPPLRWHISLYHILGALKTISYNSLRIIVKAINSSDVLYGAVGDTDGGISHFRLQIDLVLVDALAGDLLEAGRQGTYGDVGDPTPLLSQRNILKENAYNLRIELSA